MKRGHIILPVETELKTTLVPYEEQREINGKIYKRVNSALTKRGLITK
jgi:hypothetical protein